MKPELEVLSLEQQRKSINYFEVDLPSFKPYWHYHPELELTLITKGNGTRFVGNSIQAYQEGDLVLIGENLPHHWVSAEDSAEQGAMVLQFPSSLFDTFKEGEGLRHFFKQAEGGLHFPRPQQKVLDLFDQLKEASPLGRVGGLMAILDILKDDGHQQSISMVTHPAHKLLEKQQSKISKTITYILEHLNEPLTVAQMAAFTHMVPQSFCRWFRKGVGMSFITFLNSTRVENACHELINSDRSIAEIAFDNGFESIGHFNRTFRKVKDKTPSDHRSGHHQGPPSF